MNYAALWHEATQRYCYCLEPGRFLFRLQTAKDDIKSVTLHALDKYLPLKIRDTRKTTPHEEGGQRRTSGLLRSGVGI